MKVGHGDLCPLPQFQWTNQSWTTTGCAAKDTATNASIPCSRSQHASCLLGHHVYLLGGRDGYSPLKDFWRFDIECGTWENVVTADTKIPHLQGHTLVAFKSQIFIFGGTFDESLDDTPLWIYSPDLSHVKKYVCEQPLSHPMGRREHSAVVYKNCMYIYGGFMDSSGSTDELWAFNMEEETWCPLPRPKSGKRHGHVSVVHHNAMWVHGGMKGLDKLADIWMYSFSMCTWKRLKGSGLCPALSYHTGHVIDNVIILVGGMCNSSPSSSVWLYGIENNTWRQVVVAQSHLFTSVHLHTSVLVDVKMNIKDKNSQSTPHLKSHLNNAITPEVRPWTSPSSSQSSDQLPMLSGSVCPEVNVLNLESADTSMLDKNNNSEENIFSCLDSEFCHSTNDAEEEEQNIEWHNLVDLTSKDRKSFSTSNCQSSGMTDVSCGQTFKYTKIRPSSCEQCQDDLPLLERFQSVSSDVDLGESNMTVTISDENICEKDDKAAIQEVEEGSFLFDNPAFLPTVYSKSNLGIESVDVNITHVQSHQNNINLDDQWSSFTETDKESSISPSLHLQNTVEDGLKLKQSFSDLIVEDLECCDDEILRDLVIASPVLSTKCSSLKDLSSNSSFQPADEANFCSHPFSIDSPVKHFSKSCSSVDMMNINYKVCSGSLNMTSSLSNLIQLELKDIAKKHAHNLTTTKSAGKYIKRQTIYTHLNPAYVDHGKLGAYSNLQKKINLKKSIATQTGSQSSLFGTDSNLSTCGLTKQESHRKSHSGKRTESNGTNVLSGLNVFSNCKFLLLVLGGKTESASFIKTPLSIWKCKIF